MSFLVALLGARAVEAWIGDRSGFLLMSALAYSHFFHGWWYERAQFVNPLRIAKLGGIALACLAFRESVDPLVFRSAVFAVFAVHLSLDEAFLLKSFHSRAAMAMTGAIIVAMSAFGVGSYFPEFPVNTILLALIPLVGWAGYSGYDGNRIFWLWGLTFATLLAASFSDSTEWSRINIAITIAHAIRWWFHYVVKFEGRARREFALTGLAFAAAFTALSGLISTGARWDALFDPQYVYLFSLIHFLDKARASDFRGLGLEFWKGQEGAADTRASRAA